MRKPMAVPELLHALLTAPGPSGHEEEPARVWRQAAGAFADVTADTLGTTFARVTFPQIRLAVFGSALFAFNVSFDEVVVTLFISGVRAKTLPVKVWDAIFYEITPILPAISTVIIVASVLLLTPLLLARRSP